LTLFDRLVIIQGMSYQISTNLESRVQAQILLGNFANEEEVLQEALDTLEKRQLGLKKLQSMVREAEEDVVAGRVGPFDVDQTLDVIQARLIQQQNAP